MKAFIATAISNKSKYGEYYLKEVESVLHYLKIKTVKYIYDNDDTESEDNVEDKDSFNILDSIRESDIFIGEMSLPSQTLGFQLAYALNIGKICLYIYPEGSKGKPRPPLSNNPSRLLSIKQYNRNDLSEIITSFVEKATKQLRSDRITFVSTKEINDYLNSKSATSHISKGEILRKIITEYIENNQL